MFVFYWYISSTDQAQDWKDQFTKVVNIKKESKYIIASYELHIYIPRQICRQYIYKGELHMIMYIFI